MSFVVTFVSTLACLQSFCNYTFGGSRSILDGHAEPAWVESLIWARNPFSLGGEDTGDSDVIKSYNYSHQDYTLIAGCLSHGSLWSKSLLYLQPEWSSKMLGPLDNGSGIIWERGLVEGALTGSFVQLSHITHYVCQP